MWTGCGHGAARKARPAGVRASTQVDRAPTPSNRPHPVHILWSEAVREVRSAPCEARTLWVSAPTGRHGCATPARVDRRPAGPRARARTPPRRGGAARVGDPPQPASPRGAEAHARDGVIVVRLPAGLAGRRGGAGDRAARPAPDRRAAGRALGGDEGSSVGPPPRRPLPRRGPCHLGAVVGADGASLRLVHPERRDDPDQPRGGGMPASCATTCCCTSSRTCASPTTRRRSTRCSGATPSGTGRAATSRASRRAGWRRPPRMRPPAAG
jgi:hypothetical protein